jgi:hypothetical protein
MAPSRDRPRLLVFANYKIGSVRSNGSYAPCDIPLQQPPARSTPLSALHLKMQTLEQRHPDRVAFLDDLVDHLLDD